MALTWELSAGLISFIKNLRIKAKSFNTMNKNPRHQSNIKEQEKNKRGTKRKIDSREVKSNKYIKMENRQTVGHKDIKYKDKEKNAFACIVRGQENRSLV